MQRFGKLLHQVNSLEEVHKLKQNSQKNKIVTSKTQFFAADPFSTPHSICLSIGF